MRSGGTRAAADCGTLVCAAVASTHIGWSGAGGGLTPSKDLEGESVGAGRALAEPGRDGGLLLLLLSKREGSGPAEDAQRGSPPPVVSA